MAGLGQLIAVIIAEPDDRIFSRQDYAVRIYSAHIGYLHGSFFYHADAGTPQ